MAVSYPDTPGVSRYFDTYRTSLILCKECSEGLVTLHCMRPGLDLVSTTWAHWADRGIVIGYITSISHSKVCHDDTNYIMFKWKVK